ncbi:DUF481 domain-containing protein [Flammeovirga sp. SubArs3]|uniref:DUF481 domain-containing protein n=1 Tax=Flammeovirga sp. SubArs3 TaxID=2995316 RepID=UPI00248C5933|nr:DUF481 domain-containing protein [Flammeovirga sp. SubArs3]
MKNFLYIFFTVSLFFIHITSKAQILNVEKSRLDVGDSSRWVGNINVNFELINQQIETYGGGIKGNFAHVGQKHDFIVLADLSLLNSEGFDLLQNGFIHIRSKFRKHKRLSFEAFTQAQYDQVKGMNERLLLGGNARWRFFRKEQTVLIFGVGTFYEIEDWRWEEVTDTETIITTASPKLFRSNLYLKYRLDYNETVYLNFIVYHQSSFTDAQNYRISGETNINFKISSSLTFNNKFTLWYDNQPYVPIDQLNYTMKNGIIYKF